MNSSDTALQRYSAATATSIVVANMVGTGVFTSLGFQLLDIDSAPVILLLWVVGGVLALCGALCYAELGAALPRSGGEYNFLSRLYHPGMGFVSGWVSATVGFAAPTALVAITAATYAAAVFPVIDVRAAACGLVLLVAFVHSRTRATGGGFQLVFTAIKVLLIVVFVLAALLLSEGWQTVRWQPQVGDIAQIGSAGFAVALIYVNYAYTGWNAATYLVGELADPQRDLARVLLRGTGLVMLLYLALHITFLLVAPMDAMRGELEVGYVVAGYAFGDMGSALVGLMLAVLLISTISAMILAGPRTLQVIGEDYRILRWLGRTNAAGIPIVALVFQTLVTLLLVLTSGFEAILIFTGFTLALNTLLSVLGVVRLRRLGLPRPFVMPGYPWPLVIFVFITVWTLGYVAFSRPVEALLSLGIVGAGTVLFFVARDKR